MQLGRWTKTVFARIVSRTFTYFFHALLWFENFDSFCRVRTKQRPYCTHLTLLMKHIRYYFSCLYLKSDRTMFCFMGLRYITTMLFVDSLSSEISLLCLHCDMSARCSAKDFTLSSLLSHVLISAIHSIV